MSKRQCPECGRQLKPNARFCSYCGVNLEKRASSATPTPPTVTTTSVTKVEPVTVEKTPMPSSVEAALILRGKLETQRTQRASLDEELETIRVKQLIGEISETEAKKEQSKFQLRFDTISKEIEDLEKKSITPLEQLQEDKKVQEGRLQRLEDLRSSGEVDEEIYKRLASEYGEKLAEINQQLETELANAHYWLVELETRQQELEFDKETLQIRARIDEVSKREVTKQLKKLDEELNKITSILAGLRALLGASAPPPKLPKTKKPAEPPTKPKKKQLKNTCPYCQAKISPGSKYCYTCGRLLVD